MSNNNPNNITAKFYDISSSHFKGYSLILEELETIQKYCKKSGNILDIGCGTGRHLIPLIKNGFNVTGIDSSKGMLDELKKKGGAEATLIQDDFLKFKFHEGQKFDLIIMFWNTFNEICLNQKSARLLLSKSLSLLSTGGKILINSDNLENINPKFFDFSNKIEAEGLIIDYHWQTQNYIPQTNTSVSNESITISKDGKVLTTKETSITQRWWIFLEYEKMAKSLQLKCRKIKLKGNDELYILLEKNNE